MEEYKGKTIEELSELLEDLQEQQEVLFDDLDDPDLKEAYDSNEAEIARIKSAMGTTVGTFVGSTAEVEEDNTPQIERMNEQLDEMLGPKPTEFQRDEEIDTENLESSNFSDLQIDKSIFFGDGGKTKIGIMKDIDIDTYHKMRNAEFAKEVKAGRMEDTDENWERFDEEYFEELYAKGYTIEMEKGGKISTYKYLQDNLAVDEYYSQLIEKYGKKGAFERVLKDSQFGNYKGTPTNEFKHNRLPKIAITTNDSVYIESYSPNFKRNLLQRQSFSSPKELAEYLDKNQIYAKGGEIEIVNELNDMNLPKDIYSNGKIYKGKATFINGYNGYTSTKDDGYLIDEKGNYLTDKKGNNLVAKERRGVVIDLSKYAKGGKTSKFWEKTKSLGRKGYKKSKELAHEANERRKEHLHFKRKQISRNVGIETTAIIDDKVKKGEITKKRADKLNDTLVDAAMIEEGLYKYPEGPKANYEVKNMAKNLNPMDPYYAKGGDIIKDKDKEGNDGYKVFAVVDNFDYENQDYDQLYYKTDDRQEMINYISDVKSPFYDDKLDEKYGWKYNWDLIDVSSEGKMKKIHPNQYGKYTLDEVYAKGGKTKHWKDDKYWADYTDIGIYSMDRNWSNSISEEEFYKIGKDIVDTQFKGDIGNAWDSIVKGKPIHKFRKGRHFSKGGKIEERVYAIDMRANMYQDEGFFTYNQFKRYADELSDDEFMDEAETQGLVWSSMDGYMMSNEYNDQGAVDNLVERQIPVKMMVAKEYVNPDFLAKGGSLDDIVRKLDKVRNEFVDLKLKADLHTEEGVAEFRKKAETLKKEERKLEDKLEEMGEGAYTLPFEKGGFITFSDGYKFKEVSKSFAKKNWNKMEVYGINISEQSESLIDSKKDIEDFEDFGIEVEGNYAKGGKIVDNEGNSLFKGDKVVLITDDKEFLNPEDGIGNTAERGDAFEVIRHLGESDGYDDDSNSIQMKHIKTGEVSDFYGFRVLKVNPQYAKGGETASPITNYHRTIMGTLGFDLKVKGMRKPQDFIVYPITEKTDKIRIQSDKKWGEIHINSGKGILSKSGSTSWHLHSDMMNMNVIKFELTPEELEELKTQIKSTSGKDVGNTIMRTDNSGAALLEHGGEIDLNDVSIYEADENGNFTVVIDGDVFDMNYHTMPNMSINMYAGSRSEYPSDISHWGKKITFEDAPQVIKDKIGKRIEEFHTHLDKGGKIKEDKRKWSHHMWFTNEKPGDTYYYEDAVIDYLIDNPGTFKLDINRRALNKPGKLSEVYKDMGISTSSGYLNPQDIKQFAIKNDKYEWLKIEGDRGSDSRKRTIKKYLDRRKKYAEYGEGLSREELLEQIEMLNTMAWEEKDDEMRSEMLAEVNKMRTQL